MPEIKMETSDLISFSDAARILKVSRVTIYAWIEKSLLHPISIADRRYLLKDEVENLATVSEVQRFKDEKNEATT